MVENLSRGFPERPKGIWKEIKGKLNIDFTSGRLLQDSRSFNLSSKISYRYINMFKHKPDMSQSMNNILKYFLIKFEIFDTQNLYRCNVFQKVGFKVCVKKSYCDIGGTTIVITYAYERVSTKDQNLERQDIAIKQFRPQIQEENIFRDKLTGKSFNRPQYQNMKIILEHLAKANENKEMIEVVFEELDRLGRNAEGIKKELEWYKDHNICVRILEIPTTLTDIKPENKWVTDLVSQILIDVYSAMAQQELEKRIKRQTEGIEVARAKGVQFGRKPIKIDQVKFELVYKQWKSQAINAREAMEELGLKSNTFYRRVREYEAIQIRG